MYPQSYLYPRMNLHWIILFPSVCMGPITYMGSLHRAELLNEPQGEKSLTTAGYVIDHSLSVFNYLCQRVSRWELKRSKVKVKASDFATRFKIPIRAHSL